MYTILYHKNIIYYHTKNEAHTHTHRAEKKKKKSQRLLLPFSGFYWQKLSTKQKVIVSLSVAVFVSVVSSNSALLLYDILTHYSALGLYYNYQCDFYTELAGLNGN